MGKYGKNRKKHGKIWGKLGKVMGKYGENIGKKMKKKTLENGEVLVKIHGKMKL
jgi:hypothetical protein